METLQGRALVASPYLSDPNFMRTVVYILRHDEEGAVGLIVNRPMNQTVGELIGELTETEISNGQPVYYGGPVDGPLMMLQACVGVIDNAQVVYVASDQERITDIVTNRDESVSAFRVFDGYSGWGAGQLEQEMEEGGWLVWDILPEQVFGDPDELWHHAVREIGREILAGGIEGARIPKDPAIN